MDFVKNVEKPLRGSPAGRPSGAVGQQPDGSLVLNARDEHTMSWLSEQAGFEAVQEAGAMRSASAGGLLM